VQQWRRATVATPVRSSLELLILVIEECILQKHILTMAIVVLPFYGPRVWNSHPDELRSTDITLDHVQKQTEDVII